ncbi:MAG: hypothetical protein JSS02_03965 [Planctomycetes bacterium]|nr:hypothetical protein [Planctomycetota bacterium]
MESGRASTPKHEQALDGRRARFGGNPGGPREPSYAGGRSLGWMEAVHSQIAMKPISVIDAPALRERDKRVDEEFEDSRTSYKVVVPREIRKQMARRNVSSRPAGMLQIGFLHGVRSYKKLFGSFGRFFRWIDETAYGLSIPCLILAIVGAVMNKHWMTVLGISAIVLLNLVRIGAALSNLISKPFRDSPIQGVLFLIPPVTLYYLWSDWRRWHKPVKRVISPVLTLAVVIAAYTYIPWLNGNQSAQGKLRDRIEGAIQSIKQDVKGSVSEVETKFDEAKDKLPGQIEKLKDSEISNRAQQALDDIREKVHESTGGNSPESQKPATEPEPKSPGKP